jgi:hypothetical protein
MFGIRATQDKSQSTACAGILSDARAAQRAPHRGYRHTRVTQ